MTSSGSSSFLVIANASAGRTEDEALDDVRGVLARYGPVDSALLERGEDPDAALSGRGDAVPVFVGGDGTVHHGLQAVRRLGYDGPVGIIPLGTGNDFARNCGLPLDHRDAARLVGEGTARPVAAARMSTGQWVANNAHLGVGVAAAERAEPFKPVLRALSYPMATLFEGLRYGGRTLTATVDGERVLTGPVLAAVVLLGPSVGGGIELVDDAPRRLELLVVDQPRRLLDRVRLARIGFERASGGTEFDDARSDAIHRFSGSTVELASPADIRGDIDGEVGPWGRQVAFEWVPAAWSIIGAGGPERAHS